MHKAASEIGSKYAREAVARNLSDAAPVISALEVVRELASPIKEEVFVYTLLAGMSPCENEPELDKAA